MTRTSQCGLHLLVVLTLLLGSGCKCGQGGRDSPDAGTAVAVAEKTPRAEDEVRPVYPTQAGAPSPLARRFCEALHELPARRRAECCRTPPGLLLTSECVRMLSVALTTNTVKLEASAVEACSQALEQTHQGCDWVGPEALPPPAACLGILQGTLSTGARCRSSLECAEGLRCHGVGPTDTGVCGPPASTEQFCALSVDALATYTRQDTLDQQHPECQGHCDKRQCADNLTVGGKCVFEAQCGPGNHCSAGTCAQGELARLGDPCASGGCEPGARCIQGVCVAPKPAGAACERDVECLGGCVPSDGGPKGRCGPRCDGP